MGSIQMPLIWTLLVFISSSSCFIISSVSSLTTSHHADPRLHAVSPLAQRLLARRPRSSDPFADALATTSFETKASSSSSPSSSSSSSTGASITGLEPRILATGGTGRGLPVLHTQINDRNHHHNLNHHNVFADGLPPPPAPQFDWHASGNSVPSFVNEALTEGQAGKPMAPAAAPMATPGSGLGIGGGGGSLLDRAIVRAPWNVLTAKMFRLLAVFFLESYLVQLFGVELPL